MNDLTKIVQDINALKQQAFPKDHSAPLDPIIDLGRYVLNNWDVIERALIEQRQLKDNQERQRRWQ